MLTPIEDGMQTTLRPSVAFALTLLRRQKSRQIDEKCHKKCCDFNSFINLSSQGLLNMGREL